MQIVHIDRRYRRGAAAVLQDGHEGGGVDDVRVGDVTARALIEFSRALQAQIGLARGVSRNGPARG